ncbi:MAG: FaeA/PapI family transcriptional regulator [Solirubrobacteraceae bacterium]
MVPAGKLEVLLAATDGMSTAALAEQAGGRQSQVLELLRELERGGKVRRSGARRGTRWHWITDEERIQARVAELERLTRRGT